MIKLTILDGHAVNPGDLPWNFLDGIVEYKVYERTSQEEVIEHIGNSDAIFLNEIQITKDILFNHIGATVVKGTRKEKKK